MPRSRLRPVPALALVLALTALPGTAQGQFRGGGAPPQAAGAGWPPAMAGIRGGYDYNSNGSVLGAQLRIPVHRSGNVELVPNAEVTFFTGLKEYQGGVDAVWVTGGRRGGVYAGGGIAWRNTIWVPGGERETRTAPTAVVGLRTSAGGGALFGIQLETRWTYPEGGFRPRVLTLGINVPLWGRRD